MIRARAARNLVARVSAVASSIARTPKGATWLKSHPAAAALHAIPKVWPSVTIAIAAGKDWPVFQNKMIGCTHPASPQVSTARATGRPGA